MNCCCSYAGTSVCYHCINRPSEWSKPVYVINPPSTFDSTNYPSQELVSVVRCKDCKYFTLNFVENVDGVPLIVAHEICSFWGDGCKTSQEGFCSFGERREDGN